jgi:putative acyl-CoA dehydrogenase
MGMGMTEKQGGSDVRTNTSAAAPVAGSDDGEYRLTGHKWFTSAPMCDGFLVLAQAPGGLTCFLLPRILPDGLPNAIEIQRLKDKLGNRANASSELEFRDARVWRVGDEGRGVATIIEMVNGTRLDCVIGVTGQMRQAVHQAAWHCAHRSAFGGLLVDKPLMQNVLADLELDVEAATLLMMRLSGAFDRAPLDPAEAAFRRIATPVAKYWTTKICTGVVRESMECLGGNGYVEESILPRLFRESPLNAIWEGSGNVIALDVLRALGREPGAADAFLAELRLAEGAERRFDTAIGSLESALTSDAGSEAGARRLVERMALVWAASLLVRFAPSEVADAFVASRLVEPHGLLYGTLPTGLPLANLAARAQPIGL